MRIVAHARRSGTWWAVEVPEVPGLFTQAKRLDQVDSMVRDAAKLLGVEDPFEVDVVADLPSAIQAKVKAAKSSLDEAARVQRESSYRSREVAATLRSTGLSVRDVASVLGVSAQRISQIAPTKRATH